MGDAASRACWALVLAASAAGCGDAPPPPCLGDLLSAGDERTWIMSSDGTTWGWGRRAGSGDLEPPTRHWQAVSAHTLDVRAQTCLLTTAHSLQCNGFDPVDIVQWTGVQSIAQGFVRDSGTSMVLAVKDDGTVRSFDGYVGSTLDPAGGTELVSLGGEVVTMAEGDADFRSYLAIKSDGSVWAGSFLATAGPPFQIALPGRAVSVAFQQFGVESYAALEDGSVYRVDPFVTTHAPELLDVYDVKTLTAGQEHTCGLTTQGSVWCWGGNVFGEIGSGPFDSGFHFPRQVVELGNDVTAVSAGATHTCARRSDASIWCWGDDTRGQTTGRPGDPNSQAIIRSERPMQVLGCR